MSRGKQDSIESYDPRDGLLIQNRLHIPKRNLAKLVLDRFGTFSAFKHDTGITHASEFANGTKRMSNSMLLKAAHALKVSPLYLLDLTDDAGLTPSPESISEFMSNRSKIQELIDGVTLADFTPESYKAINQHVSWAGSIAEGPKTVFGFSMVDVPVSDHESPLMTRVQITDALRGIRGDYRDLNQLARDMLEAYPLTLTAMLALPPTS